MFVLLGLALKSLAIAAATLLLLRLTRARSAGERSLIAHLGLLALVILPVATLVVPAINLPLPQAMQRQLQTTLASPAAAPVSPRVAVQDRAQPASDAAVPTQTPALRLPRDWARYAYALPVAALLLVTLLALLRLVRLRAEAEVLVDPVWLSALAHAQRRMGMKSGTALLVSDALPSPISWGLARPTILLSADALAAAGEAEAIIAHELAHVGALDWAKLMLARVATAIHWFNPLAWRLAREAHQLREEAADDAVLAANIDAPDYAQLLVRVARHESRGLLLGAHGVAPGKGSLKRRVGRVLDATLPRGRAQGSWTAGFGAGMLVMAAPLAALSVSATERGARPIALPEAVRSPVAVSATATPAAQASPVVVLHPAGPSAAAPVAAPAPVQERPAPEAANDRAIKSLISAKALNVTGDYIAAIQNAAPQLGPVTVDMATGMRAVGVTPDYVRAMMATGLRIRSMDDILGARAVGVDPAYVRALVGAGFRGALDDYIALASMGVTADDVRRLRAAGVPLGVDSLAVAKTHLGRPRPNPRPSTNPRPGPDPHPAPDPDPND